MRVEAFCLETEFDRLRDAARVAEATGFDAFAVPEIHGDPFVHLTAASAGAPRMSLRTAIAVAFPRSPMITAGAAWALHANTGGRFVLGLGTQVKAHNERRFSVPWVKPAARLREYVGALRAIWRTWENGEPLSFAGEHYNFSLMTPEFAPRPTGLPRVPVYLAAVRPAMMTVAGNVADGVRLHAFTTRRYLAEVAIPRIEAALAEVGRPRKSFEICGGAFIATGPDQAAVREHVERVRYRVAFYASTPTYAPVMSLHGWDDLAAKLQGMARRGEWKEMSRQIPDEVLAEFVAAGTHDQIRSAIEARLGGLSDAIELPVPAVTDDPIRDVIQDLRRIPSAFEGQPVS
jgi:probable F420-dependent oxidoreductase